MGGASGDKFSIENILGLNEEKPAESSSSSEAPTEPSTSSESEGEASRASRPKKRTASEDGGKDKKKKKVCKRRRTAFTKSQTALLESVFVKNPYPEAHIREELSRLTGISVEQIQVWFQNRRARFRKREGSRQSLKRQLFYPSAQPLACPMYYPGVVPPTPEALSMQHHYPLLYNNISTAVKKD